MTGRITSRQRWKPWPKIHWVVRYRSEMLEEDRKCIPYVDYELIWPWMRCIGIGIHKGG